MRLYKVKKAIDTISICMVIFAYCFVLIAYTTLCTFNVKWLWGLPIILIYLGVPLFSIIISDNYRWQDPWDSDDWDIKKKQILSENKKLKKIIDKQNKLKYVKVL